MAIRVLAAVCLAGSTVVVRAQEPEQRERPLVAYHASWYEAAVADAQETSLARMPGYIDTVLLAFARPDAVYRGNLDLHGTGLEYNFPGTVLRDAIALLKERQPGTRVLVSVGGSGWAQGWANLDEHALAHLVDDLGADGVDIDFEPSEPGCAADGKGRINCASDALWITYVERLRAVLPRPMVLSVAGWSVGAYGEGRFARERPPSPWTGSMLAVLRAKAVDIDLVNIMAYDAGPAFEPHRAFLAYRSVWQGPLALGFAVMPVDTSSSAPSSGAATWLLRRIEADPLGGAMLYALNVRPERPGSLTDAALAQVLCWSLRKSGCDTPYPSPAHAVP